MLDVSFLKCYNINRGVKMKEFSERVKKILQEKKLSQAELSTLSGVTAPSLCRYLRGDIEPRIDIVRNIAQALGVSETYLLGLDEDCSIVNEKEELKKLVARNRHILTKEDKGEIIALLYGKDNG